MNYDSLVFYAPIFIAVTFVYLIAIQRPVQRGVVASKIDLCVLFFLLVDASNILALNIKFLKFILKITFY